MRVYRRTLLTRAVQNRCPTQSCGLQFNHSDTLFPVFCTPTSWASRPYRPRTRRPTWWRFWTSCSPDSTDCPRWARAISTRRLDVLPGAFLYLFLNFFFFPTHFFTFINRSAEISAAQNQDFGRLLLLHQRRAEGTGRPRRAQRAHGTVHGQSHQVSRT